MRRRGRQFIGLGLTVVAMVVVLGAPVGAQNPNNKVEFIRGQGSDSTVDIMQKLDFAFNNSIGCKVIPDGTTVSPLNHECAVKGPPFTSAENWDHDVALSFFALGSSNGLSMLANQGNPGVAKIDYARSSRSARSSDNPNLRFVAFARDATPWVNFRNESGSPANGVDRLSVQQIKDIWFNCTINNWNQVGGAVSAPILVWTSQRGSGERSTFDAFIASSGSDISEKCIPAQYTNSSAADGTRIIFENDPGPIRDCAIDPPDPAIGASCSSGDDLRSIFHLGFGAYEAFPVHPTRGKAHGADLGAICTDEPTPPDTTCNSPVVPTLATISNATFPFTRFIFNVYRGTGFATNPVPPATKRYIGEEGWICKLNTLHGLNPKTNKNYGVEIDELLVATGFAPIPPGEIGLGNTNQSKCRLSAPVPAT